MEAVKSTVNAVKNAIKPGQTVLVTGGSGFLAAHVLTSFLERGYHVRTTVRSDATAEKVKKTHQKYLSKLSFAIVKDVAEPGAFDEAVKGVDGVVHTASPFQMSVEDNVRDLLDPAVKGTTEILKAIQAHNPDVKRVVITSSFASIIDLDKGFRPGHVYTEADWNPVTWDAAATGPGPVAYCASKTFAEKAAFEFVEKNKPNFTISTICPPMIYGPNAQYVDDLSKLNTSSAEIYGFINGSKKEVGDAGFPAFADVRDVAEAHLKAYEFDGAAGQRYFITSGVYSNQQVCDIIRKNFPQLAERVPEGTPGAPLADFWRTDTGKAERELGIEFTPLEKTIVDTVNNLLELEGQLKA
ncbi:putative cinnamoyl-CoA reductase [Saccharata proteae CBS 121410]|uniref:Cinnamoyl-CoA reductase n=1 Tax=Saccharata proteae CBS 121410 TaxID=1314787 RepID=A0A9P4I2N5_9PEZI|nr:putative cinnamoyl-CoA reductase [Saccharata proteae CBS 121410]